MRRIRRRELLWAAIAAGLAGWLIFRQWRAKPAPPTQPTPERQPGAERTMYAEGP